MLLHVRKEKTCYKPMPVVYYTIRRKTLQVIRQSWICGWSAFIFAPPAGCTDHCSRIIFQCPENLQSNNCWQMSMNMTSEYTPLWDESELQRKSVSAPPLTPNSICYCLQDESFVVVWYSHSWRQQVEKVGLQIWAIRRLGKPWLGIQTFQKPICAWFWRGQVDRPQRWWRHATGLETRTIARVARNSGSGCIHHNTSWKLTNHCLSKPQFGET